MQQARHLIVACLLLSLLGACDSGREVCTLSLFVVPPPPTVTDIRDDPDAEVVRVEGWRQVTVPAGACSTESTWHRLEWEIAYDTWRTTVAAATRYDSRDDALDAGMPPEAHRAASPQPGYDALIPMPDAWAEPEQALPPASESGVAGFQLGAGEVALADWFSRQGWGPRLVVVDCRTGCCVAHAASFGDPSVQPETGDLAESRTVWPGGYEWLGLGHHPPYGAVLDEACSEAPEGPLDWSEVDACFLARLLLQPEPYCACDPPICDPDAEDTDWSSCDACRRSRE